MHIEMPFNFDCPYHLMPGFDFNCPEVCGLYSTQDRVLLFVGHMQAFLQTRLAQVGRALHQACEAFSKKAECNTNLTHSNWVAKRLSRLLAIFKLILQSQLSQLARLAQRQDGKNARRYPQPKTLDGTMSCLVLH